MTDEEVIKAVRWRYRICNYLFRLGAIWIFLGATIGAFAVRFDWDWPRYNVELIGLGIFMSGFAMTLAIYRCPVCDHYLSKFRPDKTKCAHCGARVR
ncbi:MAG: hypothetical protein WBQ76_14095 [Candidatus Korobacteraceae bacterium]